MSQPPSSKSGHALRTHLLFYVVAMSSVLGLFQLTAAYGEANLKAPPNLNGRFLTDGPAPGCPPDSRLALTIQQSGRFLTAALELDANPGQAAQPLQPEAFRLSGDWREQITLAGNAPTLATCQLPPNLTIQANFQPSTNQPDTAQPGTAQPSLSGQMQLNGQPWPFTAQRQEAAEVKREH